MITVADKVTEYRQRVLEAIGSIRVSEVAALAAALKTVKERGGAVFVAGNGGSYANAQHLVLHLREQGVRAFDLMADNAWLTAMSNDWGYDNATEELYHKLAQEGDRLLVISGSGQSRNIVGVLDNPTQGALGLLGSGGGAARGRCVTSVILPQTEYGPVEDAHSVVIHMLKEALSSGV